MHPLLKENPGSAHENGDSTDLKGLFELLITDKNAACAAVGGFFKGDRRRLTQLECAVICCTGDDCNKVIMPVLKAGILHVKFHLIETFSETPLSCILNRRLLFHISISEKGKGNLGVAECYGRRLRSLIMNNETLSL